MATNVHQLITFFFCLGICRRLAHNKLHRLEKGTFKDLMNLQELYFVSFYLNTSRLLCRVFLLEHDVVSEFGHVHARLQ